MPWPAPSRVTGPQVLVPSETLTVPVGVPEPGLSALTVNEMVTVWPLT